MNDAACSGSPFGLFQVTIMCDHHDRHLRNNNVKVTWGGVVQEIAQVVHSHKVVV